MHRVGILVFALGGVACAGDSTDPAAGGLRIAATAPPYAPAETVTVRLENTSDDTLLENLCPVHLQRRGGATWTTVHIEPPAGAVCPAYAQYFPPASALERKFALPSTLPPGSYRVVFPWLSRADHGTLGEEARASAPFTVAPR